jgi:hypothetical protein
MGNDSPLYHPCYSTLRLGYTLGRINGLLCTLYFESPQNEYYNLKIYMSSLLCKTD